MISSLFVRVGSLVLLTWVVLAAAVRAGENDNCFSIVVGKDVSAEGHVLMAHNEDDGPPQVVNHHKVPRRNHQPGDKVTLRNGAELEQAEITWSYIWSEIPGLKFSDSYINEWGVTIALNRCPSREDNPELTEGGISYYLQRLVAERARTSREGVHIAGELVERFGYDASGRTYTIADTTEGWMFCAVNGKHWLARRVPDDSVAMIANSYSVHEVNLEDTTNFLGSSDIVEYAVVRGWYDPDTDGEFDFAAAYADPKAAAHGRNLGRMWSGYRQVAAEPPEYADRLPFCVSPATKIHPHDLMKVLRDHYEGTDLFETLESGNPHDHKRTPICRYDTQTSFVVQLRRGLPVDIGVVYWVCLGSPCTSVYFPFHFGSAIFPDCWYTQAEAPTEEFYQAQIEQPFAPDRHESFWTFSRLRQTVEGRYGELSPRVRSIAGQIERRAFSLQGSIEASALRLYATDQELAKELLHNYSLGIYFSAFELLDTLNQ